MNGSGKQSFYEIQLNNSSLIAAFLVAVALGVAVFMLGVMVGRGQVADGPGDGGWAEESFAAGEETAEDEGIDTEFFEKVQETDAEAADPATEAEASPSSETTPDEEMPDEETPAEQEAPATDPRTPPDGLPAADPALPPGSGWVVQVKATPQRSEAAELQAALAASGFDAFIEEYASGGRTNYRVRVGRYEDEADARRVETALARRPDVSGTWVTRG